MPEMHKQHWYSFFKGMDYFLVAPVLILCAIGVVFIYSGSLPSGSSRVLIRHLALLAGGFAAMFVGLVVDHSIWRKFYGQLFWIGLGLLVAVFCVGRTDYGASRWIPIGGFQFQPSEYMKFALCTFLAVKLSTFKNWKDLTNPLIWICVALGLIIKQPNYSMVLLICGLVGLFMVVANFPWKFLGAIFAVGVLTLGIVGFSGGYRAARFDAWINPDKYAETKGFQSRQMKISIGNGGVLGQGIGYGTQKNGFIAFSYKDGMFALVAEEGGFLFAGPVLLCFLCILWRGYVIANNSNSKFAKFMALGLTSFIFMNALMHIAVCTGRMPTTGQPLPFISYGGTNLLVNMFFVGVLLNISKIQTGSYCKFEEVTSEFDPIECEHPTSRFRNV